MEVEDRDSLSISSSSSDELTTTLAPIGLGKRNRNLNSPRRSQQQAPKRLYPLALEKKITEGVEALKAALALNALATRNNQDVQNLIKELQKPNTFGFEVPTTTTSSSSSPTPSKEIQEIQQALKGLTTTVERLVDSTPLNREKPISKPTQKPSYAQAAKSGITIPKQTQNQQPSNRVKQAAPKLPTPTKVARKEEQDKRQLILVTTRKDFQIDAVQQRNRINTILKPVSNNQNVVVLVEKTTKGNITLTTTKDFDSDFLIRHQDLWQSVITQPCDRVQKKEKWAQIVAHGVPRDSDLVGSQENLKAEIESFNDIKIRGLPRWISPRNSTKRAGSIVFTVENQQIQDKILATKEIYVAGRRAKLARYIDIPPRAQCPICLGFGHAKEICRKLPKCKYCLGEHPTKEHTSCTGCNLVGKACKHQTIQCTNCNENHQADNKSCSAYKAVLGRARPSTTTTTPSLI